MGLATSDPFCANRTGASHSWHYCCQSSLAQLYEAVTSHLSIISRLSRNICLESRAQMALVLDDPTIATLVAGPSSDMIN